MKRIITGDTQRFAIEFEITQVSPHLLGRCCLWLNGERLGLFDDLNLLEPVLYKLTRLAEKRDQEGLSDLESSSAENLFSLITNNDDLNDECLFSIGEAFDDFLIFAFKKSEEIWFVWQLLSTSRFSYPDTPKGVRSACVGEGIYVDVLSQFRQSLKK